MHWQWRGNLCELALLYMFTSSLSQEGSGWVRVCRRACPRARLRAHFFIPCCIPFWIGVCVLFLHQLVRSCLVFLRTQMLEACKAVNEVANSNLDRYLIFVRLCTLVQIVGWHSKFVWYIPTLLPYPFPAPSLLNKNVLLIYKCNVCQQLKL